MASHMEPHYSTGPYQDQSQSQSQSQSQHPNQYQTQYHNQYQSSDQQVRPSVRPRATSGFSIHSNSTTRTRTKAEPLVESHEEKAHIKGKANPNAAMNEMQPVAAALEKPTLASLRSLSFNDQFGKPIAEPDLSNPTRARSERPLDTIRAFEAAIDNEYRVRAAQSRVGASDAQSDAGYNGGYNSRRSSSYWGGGYDSARPPPRNSSYGNGDNYDMNSNRGSYYGGQQRQPRLQQQHRQASDSQLQKHNSGPYSGGPVQPHSRDTVATGSGSASGSEPWANTTDPTGSENSSLDRVPRDDYASQGHGNNNTNNGGQYRGGAPIAEDGPYGYTSYQGGAYYNSQDAPQPPPHVAAPRKMISLGGSGNASAGASSYDMSGANYPAARPSLQQQDSGKRKSWLKRRFSGRN